VSDRSRKNGDGSRLKKRFSWRDNRQGYNSQTGRCRTTAYRSDWKMQKKGWGGARGEGGGGGTLESFKVRSSILTLGGGPNVVGRFCAY